MQCQAYLPKTLNLITGCRQDSEDFALSKAEIWVCLYLWFGRLKCTKFRVSGLGFTSSMVETASQ